jgi:hypothetical protein
VRSAALSVTLLAACGAPGPATSSDPCTPGGHVHREPLGDWCHCDRGFLAARTGLACVRDPAFTGRVTLDLGASEERACWHAARGPFAVQGDGSRVDQFLTHYTLALSPRSDGLRVATVGYRAAVSAPHVLTASRGVNLSLLEVFSEGGTRPVPVLVTRATTACQQLSQQFGFELAARAEYRLEFGPSTQPEVGFVLDQVE